jgi:hypothetical protein
VRTAERCLPKAPAGTPATIWHRSGRLSAQYIPSSDGEVALWGMEARYFHVLGFPDLGAPMYSFGAGKVARNLLRRRGQQINSITSASDLAEFTRMVSPVRTNHPLVRVGADGDGGYLVPDDLTGIAACFSPGVAESATFEDALASRGIPSFMADYSVDAPPVSNPMFRFEKKFLGMEDSASHTTLESWMQRSGPFVSDLLLQMDIEGGEYEVIFDASNDTLARFRIIVIEFHYVAAYLCNPLSFKWMQATFRKLLKHFDVVHVHPNNWDPPQLVSGYLIPPDFALPACWRG